MSSFSVSKFSGLLYIFILYCHIFFSPPLVEIEVPGGDKPVEMVVWDVFFSPLKPHISLL